MRFFAPVFSVLAAVAVAQQSTCNVNCILVPNTGLNVKAGEQYTLTWSNPSSGQITIKLQQGTDITPSSGTTLAANVDATTGKYTVSIPSNLVNSNQYTFEIIDQSNPSNINFSPLFAISGATGVSTAASATSSSASRSAAISISSVSASSSASAASSSASASSSSASRASSESSSRTSSASATATTSAPNSNTNAASSIKVEGALVVMIAAAIAAF